MVKKKTGLNFFPKLECRFCDREFFKRFGLDYHLEEFHSIEIDLNCRSVELKISPESRKDLRPRTHRTFPEQDCPKAKLKTKNVSSRPFIVSFDLESAHVIAELDVFNPSLDIKDIYSYTDCQLRASSVHLPKNFVLPHKEEMVAYYKSRSTRNVNVVPNKTFEKDSETEMNSVGKRTSPRTELEKHCSYDIPGLPDRENYDRVKSGDTSQGSYIGNSRVNKASVNRPTQACNPPWTITPISASVGSDTPSTPSQMTMNSETEIGLRSSSNWASLVEESQNPPQIEANDCFQPSSNCVSQAEKSQNPHLCQTNHVIETNDFNHTNSNFVSLTEEAQNPPQTETNDCIQPSSNCVFYVDETQTTNINPMSDLSRSDTRTEVDNDEIVCIKEVISTRHKNMKENHKAMLNALDQELEKLRQIKESLLRSTSSPAKNTRDSPQIHELGTEPITLSDDEHLTLTID